MASSELTQKQQSDVQIEEVTKDTQCGFCGLTLDEMQQPRALPCGHVHCYECIRVNYQHKEIECKTCNPKITHRDIDISALPRVSDTVVRAALSGSKSESTDSVDKKCDRCTGDDKMKAVICCTDCKKSYCHQHAEDHSYYSADHKTLPIEDASTPERYSVEKCLTHKKQDVEEICKLCKKLFCDRCKTKELCPAVGQQDTYHEVVPLSEITDEMRDNLRSLSQTVYDKIQKCRNQEKSTWKRLADLEEHVETIYTRIDKIADELIKQVNQEREGLKKEFREYLDKSFGGIDQFSEEILQKISELEVSYISAMDLADRRSSKQLLEEFDEVSAKLTEMSNNTDYEKGHTICTPYLLTGVNSVNFVAKLDFPPTTIEHMKTEKTAGGCYGVSWTEDDRILCAQDGCVEVRHATDLRLDKTTTVKDSGWVHSSVGNCEKFYFKVGSTAGKKYITYSGSLDEPAQRVLHSEEAEIPSKITQLSANKYYIASIDFLNKTLKVFSSTTEEHLFDIQLTDFQHPYGVHLTADGVLITDMNGGKLCKYALTSSPEPIWTCTGLPHPGGITTDESGFIYVCNANKLIINIISPAGEKIGELTHEKIRQSIDNKNWIQDIAMRGGKMVLACRGTSVMLFNIY